MSRLIRWLLLTSLLVPALAASTPALLVVPPEAIRAEGVPPIPISLANEVRPYTQFRHTQLLGWNHSRRSLLVSTRFGDTPQLHEVSAPGAMRRQLTFQPEPIRMASYAPGTADVLVAQQDAGGAERFDLFSVKAGRLESLTNAGRNVLGAWSRDGRLIGYSSTRRTGTDTDLYVMDPRRPSTDRRIWEAKGAGWQVADFSADGRTALVSRFVSATRQELYEVDLNSQVSRRIDPPASPAAYRSPRYGADGRIWALSDSGADVTRLGVLGRDGRFTAVAGSTPWDIELFSPHPGGRFIAYVINEEGLSRLHVLDLETGDAKMVRELPAGFASALDVAPWGDIAIALTSSWTPLDVFVVDPSTLKATQWTFGETGGLDPRRNAEAELVRVRSFDGQEISGFLYRPDPGRFPGRRPLLLDIHGGPEAQARPVFQGEKNYLINELGIAIFYPNVRGSTGFGRRFTSLDDGPDRREDALRDIEAFIDSFGADPSVDASRIGVTGASYGGYLCYASAIRYRKVLRGAACEVALSSFVTVLESMDAYRRDLRRPEYGDERDPRQRAKLIEISPLTRAAEITIPLLVVTGANDPRVPAAEAEQMVRAARSNGREVWHVVATNEGHGFIRQENDFFRFLSTVTFWNKHLFAD